MWYNNDDRFSLLELARQRIGLPLRYANLAEGWHYGFRCLIGCSNPTRTRLKLNVTRCRNPYQNRYQTVTSTRTGARLCHRYSNRYQALSQVTELSTQSCRVSYVPRLAKVVNFLAIRQVKQGTETNTFRIGFTLHSCQYVSSVFKACKVTLRVKSKLIILRQITKFKLSSLQKVKSEYYC